MEHHTEGGVSGFGGLPPGSPVRPTQRTRPYPVTVIALFQFLRAAVILFVGLSAWAFPNSNLDSRLEIRGLAYLAMQRALPTAFVLPIIAPVVAVFIASTGLGLWRLQKWARNLLLLTTGSTVALWLRYFFFESLIKNSELESATHSIDKAALSLVYCVILADALIFCCLAFYPDVSEAFVEKNG